jgi:hypothetical protein
MKPKGVRFRAIEALKRVRGSHVHVSISATYSKHTSCAELLPGQESSRHPSLLAIDG